MIFKKQNFLKMWLYVGIAALTASLLLYKRASKIYTLSKELIPSLYLVWLKEEAKRNNITSGEKIIDPVKNVATLTYKNSKNQTCKFMVPYYRTNVLVMKTKKVLLFKKIENKVDNSLDIMNFREYFNQRDKILNPKEGDYLVYDITHEPGLPYLLSPNELHGHKISIYEAENSDGTNGLWNSEFNETNRDPIMTVYEDEKLPLYFTFASQKSTEEEIET